MRRLGVGFFAAVILAITACVPTDRRATSESEASLARLDRISRGLQLRFDRPLEAAQLFAEAGSGTTLETLILRNALGVDKPELHREAVASGVLMIPTPESGTLRSIQGEEATRAIPGVTGIELTVRPGSTVLAPPDGDRYVGFVFARARSPEEVEGALRKARTTMEVLVGEPSAST